MFINKLQAIVKLFNKLKKEMWHFPRQLAMGFFWIVAASLLVHGVEGQRGGGGRGGGGRGGSGAGRSGGAEEV